MSRSYRKHPITGITHCDSEKAFKRQQNRARRQRETQLCRELALDPEADDWMPDKLYETIWGPKDGKHYMYPFDWAEDESDIRRVMNK